MCVHKIHTCICLAHHGFWSASEWRMKINRCIIDEGWMELVFSTWWWEFMWQRCYDPVLSSVHFQPPIPFFSSTHFFILTAPTTKTTTIFTTNIEATHSPFLWVGWLAECNEELIKCMNCYAPLIKYKWHEPWTLMANVHTLLLTIIS